MRNNKAILDEAARSVRRTFIGSVAGSVGMLAVVGAAGAYGMPEKLTAQALSAAMAKFNMQVPGEAEHAEPATERAGAGRASIVAVARCRRRTRDRSRGGAEVPPMSRLPRSRCRRARSGARRRARLHRVDRGGAPSPNPFRRRRCREPRRRSRDCQQPDAARAAGAADERPLLSAPMVFEAPKPADAQVLTELPKTEVVAVAPPSRPRGPLVAAEAAEVPFPHTAAGPAGQSGWPSRSRRRNSRNP